FGRMATTPIRFIASVSNEPEFLFEFGVFLAKPVCEELLQTSILFFKLHQILELVTLGCLPGGLLPLIVGLFRYSCFLDSILSALSPTCLLLDLAELMGPLLFRVCFPRCPDRRGSDRFR